MFRIFKLSEIDVKNYSQLCENDPNCPVFYKISFLNSFHDIFNKLVIAIIYDDKEYKCAIPAIIKGRVFEGLTYHGFDSLDIVVNNKYSPDLMKRNLIDGILEIYDVIKLSNFISLDSAISLLYSKKISSYKTPIIQLPHDFNHYLQSLSKSFRKKIRWEINYAEKKDILINFINTQDSKENAKQNLYRFFQLHKERILDQGQQSSLLIKENKLFHERLIDTYDGEILFTEAWYQGNCIGVLYGFINHGKYLFFNSGIVTNIPKIGIGTLLIAHTIKHLISKEIFIFDFLRGREKYKYHWTKYEQENYSYYISNNNYKALICWIKYLIDQRKRFGFRLLLGRFVRRNILK